VGHPPEHRGCALRYEDGIDLAVALVDPSEFRTLDEMFARLADLDVPGSVVLVAGKLPFEWRAKLRSSGVSFVDVSGVAEISWPRLRVSAGRFNRSQQRRRAPLPMQKGHAVVTQCLLIATLGGSQPTVGELAKRSGMGASTASRAVSQLESHGLVEKHRDGSALRIKVADVYALAELLAERTAWPHGSTISGYRWGRNVWEIASSMSDAANRAGIELALTGRTALAFLGVLGTSSPTETRFWVSATDDDLVELPGCWVWNRHRPKTATWSSPPTRGVSARPEGRIGSSRTGTRRWPTRSAYGATSHTRNRGAKNSRRNSGWRSNDDDATSEDYSDPMAERLLGMAADVLRSFGSAFGGRHLAIVGGAVPSLLAESVPTGMQKHVGTADLDLHLSLHLLDGETAEYYDSIIVGLRGLGLRPDHHDGHPVKWRRIGTHRGARLQVEFLCPARGRAGRPEAPAESTTAELNIGPTDEITALAVGFGHLVASDTVMIERTVDTSRGRLLYEFPVAGVASWLCLKTDAIMRRDKPKDAYDVVWLISALGPQTAARQVLGSPLLNDDTGDEVLAQLGRLAGQFADIDSVGPRSFADFTAGESRAGDLRFAVGAVSQFWQVIRDGHR